MKNIVFSEPLKGSRGEKSSKSGARKRLKYLESVRGYTVKETSPGIYQVSGDYLPIQIIVSKKLPEDENLWLNSLRNDLKANNLNVIIEKGRLQESDVDAYTDVILKANKKTAKEKDMSWLDTAAEIMEEKGIIAEWKEEARSEGLAEGRVDEKLQIARNLLAKGSSPEFVHEITGLSMDEIGKL